jgi:hypothetical protein
MGRWPECLGFWGSSYHPLCYFYCIYILSNYVKVSASGTDKKKIGSLNLFSCVIMLLRTYTSAKILFLVVYKCSGVLISNLAPLRL